jgi:hypothetical protein
MAGGEKRNAELPFGERVGVEAVQLHENGVVQRSHFAPPSMAKK